ncbi:unnamed protein product [Rotaria sp. Silwood1]|nr:unnamed protein product [Rotaria sp. Silwood1]
MINVEEVLYRGALLDNKQIETYRSAVGTYSSWYSFISTTKDLDIALIRGNNSCPLCIIVVYLILLKATNQSNTGKNNKESLETLDHEENVSDNGIDGGIEDALTCVVHQIPTSIADQELQASDSDDKIFTTKLEQSTSLLIQSINHFEQIPNELIYEIFDFLDISHVYNAFSNLNTRFENLLTNSSFCFNINISSMSKSTFEHYYTNIINPNKHRIKLLHLSNPFTVDRIFSPVRIALKFIRLETLIFDNIQSKYLPNILHHFISLPNLRCLILISIDSVRNLNNIYYQIFRLPTLKYCKLSLKEHVESQLLPMATDTISPIEHLVITNTIYFYELLTLLSYVPQLRRLSIHCLDGSRKKQTISWSTILNYLTHISLNIKNITSDQLESMFKNLFHQLQVLHISTSYDETYLNASQWEKWILSYMSNLHIFDFQYINSIQNAASDNNQLIYDDVIKQFSSLFWSERKWFFAYHFYRKEYRDHVIFYSTDPYRRKQYTLYKPLDKKICPRHQETNVDVVNHIDIQGEQAMMSCINYFSNPTELTLSNSFYESRIWLRVILNRIISLKQLTKLVIDCTDFRFDQFINLLRLTPNIHTLILDCQSINYIDTVSIDHTDNFQFVSNTNTITNMIIKRISSMKNIKLFIALCPRLQHLTIDINSMDFEPIVEFLLSRNNSHTRHLFSLCMKHRSKSKLTRLKTLIKSKKILDDYLIKQISSELYIWW